LAAAAVAADSAAADSVAVVVLVPREAVVPVLVPPVPARLLPVQRPVPAARHPLRERAAPLLAPLLAPLQVEAELPGRARRPVEAAVSAEAPVGLRSLLSLLWS
jgi:hypothetical protein